MAKYQSKYHALALILPWDAELYDGGRDSAERIKNMLGKELLELHWDFGEPLKLEINGAHMDVAAHMTVPVGFFLEKTPYQFGFEYEVIEKEQFLARCELVEDGQ